MTHLNDAYRARDIIAGRDVDFTKSDIGIVHFGTGAFHRAHQAVYTHDVLEKHAGDWRILGVSLQSTVTADALNKQDGIYSLSVRVDGVLKTRLIKSIKRVEAATRGADEIFECLADVRTRIVSMTVTEKAYGLLRETGGVDTTHEAIAHDLAHHDQPIGVIGMIVKGLRLRKAKGLLPYTVLCCDNLPQNGDLVKSAVLDFATQSDGSELANWIAEHGAFPNSMVDRITPATTASLIDEVRGNLGVLDQAPVETEPFSQWVVEDTFSCGRPRWEDVGVLMVRDVAPYEHMKLRMLNGAHSLIAYLGFLSGHVYVRDVMADDRLVPIIERHIEAAAQTLKPLDNVDFRAYANQLTNRFRNPNIAHETYQIAMDGSQKMPQRIFEPAVDCLRENRSIEPFALACAAWMFYCSGVREDAKQFELRDPREMELLEAYQSGAGNAKNISANFFNLPSLFPSELIENDAWRTSVQNYLALMIADGIAKALSAYAD